MASEGAIHEVAGQLGTKETPRRRRQGEVAALTHLLAQAHPRMSAWGRVAAQATFSPRSSPSPLSCETAAPIFLTPKAFRDSESGALTYGESCGLVCVAHSFRFNHSPP